NWDEYPAALGCIEGHCHTHALPASFTPFFLYPKSPDSGKNATTSEYNPKEATALLAAAGFDDDNPLEFELHYTSEYAGEQLTSELMVDQLSRIGVKVTLDQYAYTDYQQKYKVSTSGSFRNWDGIVGNRPAAFADPG